jgi:endo-1,3-1,4-beta-glycanase ExoK
MLPYLQYPRPDTRSFRSSLLAVCTAAVLAPLLVGTAPAQAKAYKGAEVYSSKSVLYGRMEMRMRMIRGSGLLSTFFTYKGGSELTGALWEEIDIEALGKNDAKAWQSNLITGNPRVTSEQVHTAPTSLADDYHTYLIEWGPDYVSWSLDDTEVRRTQGGQASQLLNPHTLRFNAWSSESTGWAGELDESALPAYQFVNWIRYYRYDNGQFVLDWTDDFDAFDASVWAKGNWTFDGNRVDFDPANAVVQDGTLVLAITKEGATGFTGTVPTDPQGNAANAPVRPSTPTVPTAPTTPTASSSASGCSLVPSPPGRGGAAWTLGACILAAIRRRRSAAIRDPQA